MSSSSSVSSSIRSSFSSSSPLNLSSTTTPNDSDIDDSLVHDVLIIGAGPCGLAVATRLHEHTPSALFTDEEHRRYHWLRKNSARAAIKNKKTGRSILPKESVQDKPDILVLDGSGKEWMTRWHQMFRRFKISHLRSPMFFHVDPRDRDGLLAYTYNQDRESGLLEIPGTVGKEISKHKTKKCSRSERKKDQNGNNPTYKTKLRTEIDERERQDYFTPSSKLFEDYCHDTITRYNLSADMLRSETVLDIDYHSSTMDGQPYFTVTTSKGVHHALTVVLAVGAGNDPKIPAELSNHKATEGACHAFHITTFPPPHVQAKIAARIPTNIVVIDGGLTSAQLADLAIKHGVVEIKPFDVHLSYLSKYRNTALASFHSMSSDAERLFILACARNGGSITPRFHKILQSDITAHKLSLHQQTTLSSQTWNAERKTWSLTTTPPIPELHNTEIDYIYYATGINSDTNNLPYLRTMQSKYPIETLSRLPVLTPDLMWKEEVPLFVTGKLAGLRLGPGAGNLEGARVGAERVVWGFQDVLGRVRKSGHEIEGERKSMEDEQERECDMEYWYCAGLGSRFASLEVAESSSTLTSQVSA